QTEAELNKVDEVPARLRQRFAPAILECVATAGARPQEELPVPPLRQRREVDPSAEERFKKLRQWRSVKARELELDPGILINNSILIQIAYQVPQTSAELAAIEGIRHWQRQVLGAELLENVAE
ncbi:MAG: HRDC domain-containing protein, partial [Desulfuromonas sp.]